MHNQAYRNTISEIDTIPEVPLKQWKTLAKQIQLKCLHSKRLTNHQSNFDSEIDNLTQNWDASTRERFRYWFRNTYASEINKMQRLAQYAPHGIKTQVEDFEVKRKSLIRRLRRFQNEMAELFNSSQKAVEWTNNSKLKSGEEKLEYILSKINEICTLLSTLRTKEVTAAVLCRTAAHFDSLSPEVGKRFDNAVGGYSGIIRTAKTLETKDVARILRQELEAFHYGTHLRRLFQAYDTLSQLGLTNIAESIEEIIQKELGSLTGISKKLTEVYGDLLKIPLDQLRPSTTEAPEKTGLSTSKPTPPEIAARPLQ